MGFKIPFEYMGIYFENGKYSINTPNVIKQDVVDYIMKKIATLNEATMMDVNEENFKAIMNNGIVSYMCFDECSILFRTFGTKTKYGFVHELEGMVFDCKYTRTAWIFIDKFVALLSQNEFYSLQKTCVVDEELLNNVSSRKNNLWDKLCEEKEFDNNVILSERPKGFEYINKNIKLKNETETEKIDVSKILEIEHLHISEGVSEDCIYYEYPNAKKHAKEQGFFKATKEIMDMKKSGKVFWYYNDVENSYIESSVLENDVIDFTKLK